jgi:hypothetical protein
MVGKHSFCIFIDGSLPNAGREAFIDGSLPNAGWEASFFL